MMKVLRSVIICLAVMVGNVLAEPSVVKEPALAVDEAPLASPTPYQVIDTTTERVMTIITEAKDYFETDPQRFYTQIETVLGEVIDFNSFARGVMGSYASKKRYMALATKEEKVQFKARMKLFSETFRHGLVQTYAKGLLAFNGNKVELLPPREGDAGKSSVTVVQHIYGTAEKPYEVHYKMRKNRAGEWKLRNVTIEAINLGRIYQSQFASAVKQHNGDIDKVIANWSVDPTAEADKIAESEAG